MAGKRCAHVYRDTPKARERNRVGQQCTQWAVHETAFCKYHGGASSQVIDKARRDRYAAELEQAALLAVRTDPNPHEGGTDGFTELWPETHERLDPVSLLLWEIRRSGARIEWFDRQIDKLAQERDLWWGITKHESIGATEFAGTNKTYEARENVIVKMQNEERKRLKDLRDEWQNNKFDALKIAGYGAFRVSMRNALAAMAEEFEIDLTDPATQARLRSALEALPEPIVGIDAPVQATRQLGTPQAVR